MAIHVEKINSMLNEDLTKEELDLIKQTEDFIDNQILAKKGESVYINFLYITFNSHPVLGDKIKHKFHQARKNKMKEEIEKRYKDAGWTITTSYDDMRDLMSSGIDYWILNL